MSGGSKLRRVANPPNEVGPRIESVVRSQRPAGVHVQRKPVVFQRSERPFRCGVLE